MPNSERRDARAGLWRRGIGVFGGARGWLKVLGLAGCLLPGAGEVRGAGFTEIEPLSAGIRFTNWLSKERLVENFNLMNGAGVAAGDIDGDGLTDLYFCAIAGTNALYRNLGDWRFEEVTKKWGGECANWNSSGAVFADTDGDGDLDLLVSTLGRGVHLFENDGGRFTSRTREAGLDSQTGSTSMALADVDGDGDLDLYVANYGARAILRGGGRAEARLVNGRMVLVGTNAHRLRIVNGRVEEVGEPDAFYLNEGKGRFERVPWSAGRFLDAEGKTREEPWDYGLSVVMRDFNEDGAPDVYVCNDFQTVDRLWLNDGRGFFRLCPPVTLRKESFSSMGIDMGDIDRDGFLDFFVTEMRPVDLPRRLRSISGAPPFFPAPGWIENRPEVARNTLFWNRGNSRFAEIAEFSGVAATDWSWQPFFLDVDLDGLEDLLVLNGALRDVQDRDTIERIRGLLARSPEQNRTNVMMFPTYYSPNAAFRNKGGLRFELASQRWGFDSRKISQGACLADLDADGDLDLVSNALGDGPLLCRNDSESRRIAVRLEGRAPNTRGVGARIRVFSEGLPDQTQEMIAGGRYLSGDDYVRSFAVKGKTRVEVDWPGGMVSVVADAALGGVIVVPQDRAARGKVAETRGVKPMFREVPGELPFTHREELFDDYSYQPLLPFQLSQRGPSLMLFDLDGDAMEEAIAGSGAGGKPAVFKRREGKFEPVNNSELPVCDGDLVAMCGWLWKSGERSVLIVKSGYEVPGKGDELLELRLNASGELSLRPLKVELPEGVIGCLAAADYDGDGDLDLFAGGHFRRGEYPAPVSSRLYRQENGALTPDRANSSALGTGNVVSAIWLDLNGDGTVELLAANEWGPIRVFSNTRGSLRDATREFGLAKLTGLWTSLSSGDFDGDGKVDVVAGNWGENTGWHASPEHPYLLYYSEGGGEGGKILETEVDRGTGDYFAVRSLNVLARAFPELQEHFRSNGEFASTPVAGLLPRLRVEMKAAEARTFRSTVFLNRSGTFEIRPLPPAAQLAPVFAPVVADFNGDGKEDLFLSQNFFAYRPELARADAGCGLLLLGRGDGEFSAIPPAESGLEIHGEQRGAVARDFARDGALELLVTQNGGPLKGFERRGAADRVNAQGGVRQ